MYRVTGLDGKFRESALGGWRRYLGGQLGYSGIAYRQDRSRMRFVQKNTA